MPNFVDTTPAGECLFCKLQSGALPAVKLFEDDLVFAFLDRGPVNRGHALVATKRHATSLLDITDDEAAAVMRAGRRIAKALYQVYDCPGLTLLQANGKDGGQTVFHFHLHVVPRYPGDGTGLIWPRKEVPMPSLAEDGVLIERRLNSLQTERKNS